MGKTKQAEKTDLTGTERLAAAIDLGASAVRMLLVEIREDDEWRVLENLSYPIGLGKEVFLNGRILPETTETVTGIFRRLRQLLAEYRLENPARVRAVATSAVREAANREAFLDRIFVATGIQVEVAAASDINRMTFMALAPLLKKDKRLANGSLLVAEVGGGVTEFLGLEKGLVKFSRTTKLGLLRLREQSVEHRVAANKLKFFLKGQIDSSLDQLQRMEFDRNPTMLLMGGEARFAATVLCPGWEEEGICRLPVIALEKLAEETLALSVEDLAACRRISFAEAEILGPALLCHVRIANVFGAKEVTVTGTSLRDGIIAEIAGGRLWNREFRAQVIASAVEIGEKYQWDRRHAETVAGYARRLFAAMAPEHGLPQHSGLILEVAALLHDIGTYIATQAHHKHSMYLIRNSELFGLGERHLQMVALIARYHRKAPPQPDHEEFMQLDRGGRVAVLKLAAILRVADALDRSHECLLGKRVVFETAEGQLRISFPRPDGDWSTEQVSLEEKGDMLKDVFGLEPVLMAE
jgi:exopolyphosphatase/guanosine-5'-triphosphate,3'-diphosphate pyrophosphatase